MYLAPNIHVPFIICCKKNPIKLYLALCTAKTEHFNNVKVFFSCGKQGSHGDVVVCNCSVGLLLRKKLASRLLLKFAGR